MRRVWMRPDWTFLDALPLFVVLIDRAGHVVRANPAGATLADPAALTTGDKCSVEQATADGATAPC